MQSYRLTFPNAAGQALSARIDLPVDNDPVAWALFAHCFTCSKNLTAVRHITTALTREGIAVLRFDFTGLGESEGEFAETTFTSNVEDLVVAAEYLAAHHEAPKILIGHSLGGTAMICAAPHIPGSVAIATIGAPFDPVHVRKLLQDSAEEIARHGTATVEIGGRPFTISKRFLDDIERQPMEEKIRHLDRALLVLHSPVDQIVGIENAARIFEAAVHPKSFVSLDRADHLLTEEEDAWYAGAVIAAWGRKYIGRGQEEAKEPVTGTSRVTASIGSAGYRTEILANGHPLVADEPVSAGGTNCGATPYDLVAAGLGACTAMTLRMYADHKGWPLESVTVHLTHRKIHAEDCEECDEKPARLDRIDRELEIAGPLDEAQRRRLVEIADKCPVHKTLEGGIEVATTLRETAAPGAER